MGNKRGQTLPRSPTRAFPFWSLTLRGTKETKRRHGQEVLMLLNRCSFVGMRCEEVKGPRQQQNMTTPPTTGGFVWAVSAAGSPEALLFDRNTRAASSGHHPSSGSFTDRGAYGLRGKWRKLPPASEQIALALPESSPDLFFNAPLCRRSFSTHRVVPGAPGWLAHFLPLDRNHTDSDICTRTQLPSRHVSLHEQSSLSCPLMFIN